MCRNILTTLKKYSKIIKRTIVRDIVGEGEM